MAQVLLFHHILGRTPGLEALAERFRSGGHDVHLADLFEGRVFGSRDEGRAYVEEVGTDALAERARAVAEGLPDELVYAGVSLGVLPAQLLTQTRPGAQGLLAVSAAIDPAAFGTPWPAGVPMQIHAEAEDPLMLEEGDLDTARTLAESLPGTELVLYPGSGHLFVEPASPDHDPAATDLLVERALAFLAAVPGQEAGRSR